VTSIVPVRDASRLITRFDELVLPTDTAGQVLYTDGQVLSSFVDAYILPTINGMVSRASAVVRRQARLGVRTVHVCLSTSSLMSSAPSRVVTDAATIDPFYGDRFVFDAVLGGDVWIVAPEPEALRSGLYHWLFALGYRQYLPHSAWIVQPSGTNVNALQHSGVVAPAFRTFAAAGNGNYLPKTGAPNIPNQAQSQTFWFDYYARNRWPASWQAGFDGDENFTIHSQWFDRHDHTRLAWNAGHPRGWNATSGNYPAAYFTAEQLCKVNYTHHGTPGVARDAAGVGSTPWVGVTVAAPGTTQANQEAISGLSAGALDPDPNTDSAADLVQTDYVSFSGVARDEARLKRDVLCVRINTNRPNHPIAKYVSAEPNDGTSHCACTSCVNLLRNGPWSAYLSPAQQTQDSTISDRVTHLANFQASYLAYWFHGTTTAKACWLAYGEHAAPPNIPIDSNALVMALPDTYQVFYLRLREEFLADWAAKLATNPLGAFELGMQPSWLLGGTNLDLPRMSPRTMFAEAKAYIAAGVTSMIAQTSCSSFSVGIGFAAIARLVWDSTTTIDGYLDELFSKLGAAATNARAMFERWWYTPPRAQFDQFTLNANELAQSFKNLTDAQTALNAAPDAAAQSRFDQVIADLQWFRVLYEHRSARRAFQRSPTTANEAAFWTAADACQSWAWNIATTNAIHSNHVAFSVWFNELVNGVAGGGITNFTSGATLLAIAGTPVVDKLRIEVTTAGLVGTAQFRWSTDGGGSWTSGVLTNPAGNALAGTGVTVTFPGLVNFATTYVFAINWLLINKWNSSTPGSGFASVAEPSSAAIAAVLASGAAAYPFDAAKARRQFSETLVPLTTSASTTLVQSCANSQQPQSYVFRKGAADLTFTFRAFQFSASPSGVPSRCVVRNATTGVIVNDFAVSAAGAQFSNTDTTCTVTAAAGNYLLDLIPSAGEGLSVLFQQRNPFVQINGNAPFVNYDGSAVRIYFYVPLGTTKVLLSFDSGPGIQFYDDTGATVATTVGYQQWEATVAPGRDGAVWSFTGIQTTLLTLMPYLENCPNVFAYDPAQMMVPSGLDGH